MDADKFTQQLEEENERLGTHIHSKAELDGELASAAARKKAIDAKKSAQAGAEVAHAKDVVAKHEGHSDEQHITAQDIQDDLDAAAARKAALDAEKSAHAGSMAGHHHSHESSA